MELGFCGRQLNVVFLAIIKCEVKKKLKVVEIIAEEDGIVSLANTSNVDVTTLREIYTKISVLWD